MLIRFTPLIGYEKVKEFMLIAAFILLLLFMAYLLSGMGGRWDD